MRFYGLYRDWCGGVEGHASNIRPDVCRRHTGVMQEAVRSDSAVSIAEVPMGIAGIKPGPHQLIIPLKAAIRA